MGRRSKFTEETQQKIISAIRLGMTYERAALAAGIAVSTFYKWKKEAEEQKWGQKKEFLDALKKAEAEGEAMLLQRIQKEAKNGTWQAAAWILERRHRERWGRNLDVTSGGEPVTLRVVYERSNMTQADESADA